MQSGAEAASRRAVTLTKLTDAKERSDGKGEQRQICPKLDGDPRRGPFKPVRTRSVRLSEPEAEVGCRGSASPDVERARAVARRRPHMPLVNNYLSLLHPLVPGLLRLTCWLIRLRIDCAISE